MYEFGKIVLLKDDWLKGINITDVLVEPVNAARNALKGSDHESLKRLWESIELGFDGWKEQQSHLPVKNPLEVNSAIDYEAARFIYYESVAKVSALLLIYAVLTLEAASRGDEKGANKAYQQLNKYSRIVEMKNALRTHAYVHELESKLRPIKEGQRKGAKAVEPINESIKVKNIALVLKSAKKYIDIVPEDNLIGSICRNTGLSRPTVTKHLKDLRKDGKLPNKA